jgi:hypothetical protein
MHNSENREPRSTCSLFCKTPVREAPAGSQDVVMGSHSLLLNRFSTCPLTLLPSLEQRGYLNKKYVSKTGFYLGTSSPYDTLSGAIII